MNALFRYPGSKWSLAQWIISHFPEGYEKMVYLEPFLGSGAVFFNKRPSCVETINDLDGDVTNLFRVLRERPEELALALRLTPYSREEYNTAFEPCGDPLEKARRLIVKTTQAIGARMDGKSGWRNHKQPEIGGSAGKWHQTSNGVLEAAKRLLGDFTHLVQIEQMDALRLVERYDNPQCLIYLDPPYLRSTRRSGALYHCELDEEYHKRLLEAIRKSRAHILISGYDSHLYREALAGWGWDCAVSRLTSTGQATEMLWYNFQPPCEQMTIWQEYQRIV